MFPYNNPAVFMRNFISIVRPLIPVATEIKSSPTPYILCFQGHCYYVFGQKYNGLDADAALGFFRATLFFRLSG